MLVPSSLHRFPISNRAKPHSQVTAHIDARFHPKKKHRPKTRRDRREATESHGQPQDLLHHGAEPHKDNSLAAKYQPETLPCRERHPYNALAPTNLTSEQIETHSSGLWADGRLLWLHHHCRPYTCMHRTRNARWPSVSGWHGVSGCNCVFFFLLFPSAGRRCTFVVSQRLACCLLAYGQHGGGGGGIQGPNFDVRAMFLVPQTPQRTAPRRGEVSRGEKRGRGCRNATTVDKTMLSGFIRLCCCWV